MAWKGFEDRGVWWSTFNGTERWSDQRRVPGVGTIDSTALVEYQGRLHMFWKGLDGDNTIRTTSLGPTDADWQRQR